MFRSIERIFIVCSMGFEKKEPYLHFLPSSEQRISCDILPAVAFTSSLRWSIIIKGAQRGVIYLHLSASFPISLKIFTILAGKCISGAIFSKKWLWIKKQPQNLFQKWNEFFWMVWVLNETEEIQGTHPLFTPLIIMLDKWCFKILLLPRFLVTY